jgi:hypothetical protein
MRSILAIGILCVIVNPIFGMKKLQEIMQEPTNSRRVGLMEKRSFEEVIDVSVLTGKSGLIQGANELRILVEELLEQESVGSKMVYEINTILDNKEINYDEGLLKQLGSLLVFTQNQLCKEIHEDDAALQLKYYVEQLDARIKAEIERLQQREFHRITSEKSPRKKILRKVSSRLSLRKDSLRDESPRDKK